VSLDRFGTTFEVKSIEQRVISGHAAAWALDRVGDVIERTAFRKTLAEKHPSDVAVFIGHKADELPVGVPLSIEPDEHGLFTQVKVFDGPAGDNLLAVAKGLKAAGQTLGLSIGFRIRDARMDRVQGKSVRVLTDIDLIEFSYAARQTVANPAALMTDVKTGGGMYTVGKSGDKWAVMRDGEAIGGAFDTEEMAQSRCDTLNKDADGKTLPNTLPDSAFLLIAHGGVLDDEQKTVPRTLRHFRYRDAAGTLDTDALTAAIIAISQAKTVIPDERERARLAAHARCLQRADVKTIDDAEWRSETALDLLAVAYGLIDAVGALAEQHKALAVVGQTTNGGRRMPIEMREHLERQAPRGPADYQRSAGHHRAV
jgi:HK97 family phage prohead protease